MLIVCPNCATSYDVDVATLRPNGRQVRCVRCRTVWQAELSRADKLTAAAEALAPVPPTVEVLAEAGAEGPGRALPAEHFDAAASAAADVQPDIAAAETPAEEIPSDIAESMDAAALDDAPAMESPPIVPGDLQMDQPPIEDGAVAIEAMHVVRAIQDESRSSAVGLDLPFGF